MLLLASILGCIMPCNFTVDHDIGNAVAAKPIGAMNAACNLAGGEKAGDGRFIGAKDVHVGIYPNAAHGMVNGRFHADGVVRRRFQRGR